MYIMRSVVLILTLLLVALYCHHLDAVGTALLSAMRTH